jgi:hypothetical protein
MGLRGQFARQQSWAAHVRFGSKTDNVRGGKNYIETIWGRGYVMREQLEAAATISA